jgi:hypothetical protein
LRAVRLFAAAEASRASIGTPLDFLDLDEYETCLQAVRSALGEEAFAAAWAEGRALTLEQAVARALEDSET